MAVTRKTPPASAGRRADDLRTFATERIHRVRRFKLHLVLFALGLPLLGAIWVLTEYFRAHLVEPVRVRAGCGGHLGPWFFFAAGIWALIGLIQG